MSKQLRQHQRHAFKFKIEDEESGKPKVLTAHAVVRRATQAVELILTAADVRRSIKLGGVGNTQTCSMAVCAKRQANAFPHPVEGYIDWQYRRAFVVSKVSKETGLPTACVVYDHNDAIAKLNDTKGGQQKLLEELEAEGSRVIRLNPIRARKPSRPGKPMGRRDGSRTAYSAGKGANLRFAFAKLGGAIA